MWKSDSADDIFPLSIIPHIWSNPFDRNKDNHLCHRLRDWLPRQERQLHESTGHHDVYRQIYVGCLYCGVYIGRGRYMVWVGILNTMDYQVTVTAASIYERQLGEIRRLEG